MRMILTADQTSFLWGCIEGTRRKLQAYIGSYLPSFPPKPLRVEGAAATAVGLALDAGLRPCEIARYRWCFLQGLANGMAFVTVPRSIAKRARERQLTASGRLTALLCTVRDFKQQWGAWTDQQLVVRPESRAARFPTRTLQRYCLRYTAALEGGARTLYDLRHTFATNLLRVSNLRLVQEALGHSNLSSTERYLHVQSGELQTAVSAMEVASANGK